MKTMPSYELEARVAAYNMAIALELLVHCAANKANGAEVAREKFTNSSWEFFARQPLLEMLLEAAREKDQGGMDTIIASIDKLRR